MKGQGITPLTFYLQKQNIQSMIKYLHGRLAILLFAVAVIATLPFAGCKSNNLEPGGAYAPANPVVTEGVTNWVATVSPDPIFYSTDVAFNFAYTLVDTAFTFEKNNRQLLWSISPDIKKTLDRFRPQAAAIVLQYTASRKAYMATPTPAGLTQLQTLLSHLQSLNSAVQAALPAKL